MVANVNLAALHYHFRSKENIIKEAVEIFFSRIEKYFLILKKEEVSPELRLKEFIKVYTLNFIEYPGVFISQIGMMVQNVLNSKDHETIKDGVPQLFKTLSHGLGVLKKTLSDYLGIQDNKIISMKAVQLITSIAHPLLLTDLPLQLFHINYKDPLEREAYIEMVIKSLL